MKDKIEIPEEKLLEGIQNRNEDVLICAGSPEERCLGSIRRLAKDYKANNSFILCYSDHRNERRRLHLEEMSQRLKIIGDCTEFKIDEEKPIPVLNSIVDKIEECVRGKANPKISFDISTIIKWHILFLLRALEKKDLLKGIRFLYTEPEDYVTNLFQPLSFGIREIFPIPTYYGNYDLSKESLLILMLGYEGDRAIALLEDIDPTDCLLLIPKPAYHPEWDGRTEEMNKEIINLVGKSKIEYIDSRNPVKVAIQMKKLLSNGKYATYNHIISPLGTKPQTLGLFLYIASRPVDTNLLYAAPLKHNELFYSKGVGRTWILPFRQENEQV